MKRSDIIETLKEMCDIEMDARCIEALEAAIAFTSDYGWISSDFMNPRCADQYNVVMVFDEKTGIPVIGEAWWDGKKWTANALEVNVSLWRPIIDD